ncbi:MAG: CHAT domain-containing tetratricopeptide repeat protein [Phormidesmis sp. CAN_BIN44]|nr:CHAT domain-containing tetratricopeptide repeat protein [Phormidesmis sp. CAN_BIN44]
MLPASAQTTDARKTEADRLLQQGLRQYQTSQFRASLNSWQQALPIFRALRDHSGEAWTLNNLGVIFDSLAQYGKAIEYYQQALPIFRALRDHKGEASALANLGRAYNSHSQYGKAIEYYQQALPIFRALPDHSGEAWTLNNLGVIYDSLAQYGKAIEYHQQALPIFRTVGDRVGEGAALNNLGKAYTFSSQYGEAIKTLQQALPIFRALDYNGEASALTNLGNAYLSLAQYGKAIEYYQQALSIFQTVGGRNDGAAALTNLGIAYGALSQYGRAIEYHQQALPIFQTVGDRDGEGSALNNLGYAFLDTKDFPSAERNFFAAITAWESLRPELTDENKISLFEEQATAYHGAQLALIAQNKPEAALEVAERGRARAFVELLAERFSRQESGVKSQAVIQSPNLQQIRQISNTHNNATLVQYSIIYEKFQSQGKRVWLESALYIWVIQPAGEITFRQVDLKPLWKQHNASLADLTIGNQEFLAVRSRSDNRSTKLQPNLPTLHQLLIEPIASLLPKDPNAHVIFIPQGSLFQVPFPALQDANGTYLIQKHTILTAPSIQVLALTRQQRQRLDNQKPGNALVLGNPTMPSVSSSPGVPKRSLSPLPGAEIEAKAIAPLLNTQAIIGAQGTKAAIVQKMPQASIIHLATHGILDDVRGLGSAIALAPSGKDDGLLTAEEILDMRLRADLVVLSACNTAQGRTTGDGIIGLSRSFISAGVPSVIVSLWSVPDAPTAELMQAFYKNLQKNPDKAQALRQAMLTTMKTHPQPRDWAAFTLIGEAD